MDLTYIVIEEENTYLNFPLTEKKCDYIFSNLKYLSLSYCFDCSDCLKMFPEDLFKNLSENFKFCPVLERIYISNEYLKTHINDIKMIINGIKVLKRLRELIIEDRTVHAREINEDEFYKYYPEYIKMCPFLNNIKIKISELNRSFVLTERNTEYKYNDIIVNNYKYIKTLGTKDSFSTYLCINENKIKVVIRKIKKSIIEVDIESFNNEKYCLKKFKNYPNIIKYIEFLEDEHYEYIVYEYIENAIKKCRSNHIGRKILLTLYENFYCGLPSH